MSVAEPALRRWTVAEYFRAAEAGVFGPEDTVGHCRCRAWPAEGRREPRSRSSAARSQGARAARQWPAVSGWNAPARRRRPDADRHHAEPALRHPKGWAPCVAAPAGGRGEPSPRAGAAADRHTRGAGGAGEGGAGGAFGVSLVLGG